MWVIILIVNGCCHNPIFTHRIFSGVGTQNGTARTKPAWPDEASPHQILPWRRFGTHFQRFDQVWLGLTNVWPRFDRAVSNPTRTHRAQKPSKCSPRYISKNLESFDQIQPSLTKVWPNHWPDQKLNRTDHSLTILKNMMRASIRHFTGQKRTRDEEVMIKTVEKRSDT